MLAVQELRISDVKVITGSRFEDERGFFSETYHRQRYHEAGITAEFIQDNHSCSEAIFTVRGLHMQVPPFAQAKLVRVTQGRILDVCVDVRRESPTYGQWIAAEISAQKWNQLYVPIGFLHGFVTLEPRTEVHYKVSAYYDRASEIGVIWNDPELKIDWRISGEAILSPKDADLPSFHELRSPF